MLFGLKHDPIWIEKITKTCKREKRPLPPELQNPPRLGAGLTVFQLAWSDLETERQIGMAMGPIPWSKIRDWAHSYGIVGAEYRRFNHVIRMLDSAYLNHVNKRKSPDGG